MKKTGSNAPMTEPTGRQYWRSLDHMVETEEFREWLNNEFPSAAREAADGPTRRHFLKIMSASFLFAGFGLTGCRRPEEHLIPFTRGSADYTHGVPEFFATSRPTRSGAVPLLAKSADGRPVKLERNSQHPDSTGTDAQTQASILDLYDPDRQKQVLQGSNAVTRAAGVDKLRAVAKDLNTTKGDGYAFLFDSANSPSRDRLVGSLKAKYPKASIHHYDPLAPRLEGVSHKPFYDLRKADLIVSLGSDFLGTEDDATRFTRDFARGRKISSPGDSMNRLYVVEGPMTITGGAADHRLRTAPSQIEKFAAYLALEIILADNNSNAKAVLGDSYADLVQELNSIKEGAGNLIASWSAWVAACKKDILAHQGHVAFVPGAGQPASVHLISQVLNSILGNVGTTVHYTPADSNEFASLQLLANAIEGSTVKNVIMVGGNPVYNAPADLQWAEVQKKAEIIRLTDRLDESSDGVSWSFPRSHFLESWGDARTSDGTLVSVQPLIAPLFDSFSDLEFLALLAGEQTTKPHEIVRRTFQTVSQTDDLESAWKQFLHDGFLKDSYFRHSKPDFQWASFIESFRKVKPLPAPGKENLEVVFLPDSKVGDGSFTNNGWLQELPDPITKITWDNVILVSPTTAKALGLPGSNREGATSYNIARMVELELNGRKIKGPVWVQSGFADFTLGLVSGYGRTKCGRVGEATGYYNAFAVRIDKNPFIDQGAKVTSLSDKVELACTQDHGSMEGRPIIREANIQQFRKHPQFASDAMGIASHFPHDVPAKVYNHPYENYEKDAKKNQDEGKPAPYPIIKSSVHQWAMTIDLNACTGCNACVVSCQSENNIPIVGKDQVRRGREMHWLRIDRYFSAPVAVDEGKEKGSLRDDRDLPDDPQIAIQPMACVHCENAPCESVCPVNATVHDEEGLNLMVYNRCVGTRYCSNNCPYKVRRFNFFDYNLRPLDALYDSPVFMKKLPRRPADEVELMKMVRNPDVSVRMRGVMEKCTYCIQRIEGAKIAQKIKAGASDNVEVPDGTIRTACLDACPADAIVFGNKMDPNSAVSLSINNPRNYSVLGYLETKARTTYLARVRNPNPEMPDYQESTMSPYTTQEYFRSNNEDPFEHHGHGAHGGDHEGDHENHDTHAKEGSH